MPLYEYLCRNCDKEVEVLVRSSEERAECPDCGGGKLTKLLSVTAAPATGGGTESAGPSGPCGSSCGCFPQG